MSLLKKLVGLTIGAAAVGAAAYFLTVTSIPRSTSIFGARRMKQTPRMALPRPPSPLTMRLPRPKKPPLHLKKPRRSIEEAPEAEAAPVQAPAGDDTPNANPVELGAVEVPKTEDGKLDVTKIADPADFGDWDEQGCKG